MEELDKEQLAMLRKAFDTFDRDKKGYITADTVGQILHMMGQKFSSRDLKELIEEIDVDRSGQIEFPEFITLAARFMAEEDNEGIEQELKEAFRLYDKEGNGYITTQTLKEILRELDDKLTNEDLDNIIEEVDTDGSGTLDFDGKVKIANSGSNVFLKNLWK